MPVPGYDLGFVGAEARTLGFQIYFHFKSGARVPIQSAPPFAFFTNSFSGEEVKTKETAASPPQLTSYRLGIAVALIRRHVPGFHAALAAPHR